MASLSETLVWTQVSSSRKITSTIKKQDNTLFELSYSALPFWINVASRLRDTNNYDPILNYLKYYLELGKPIASLKKLIMILHGVPNLNIKTSNTFMPLLFAARIMILGAMLIIKNK